MSRLSVLAALLLAGCWSSPAPAPAESPAPAPAADAPAPLQAVERWVGGARPGDDVPVIVAVHGLGDRPEHFAEVFAAWPTPARVVLPQAPTPWHEGYAWMTVRASEGRVEEQGRQLAEAASRVADLCRSLADGHDKPVLTGFSQGGMIAWTVAAHHPDTIAGAVPVAGYLPPMLRPDPDARVAPVHALHGEADEVLAVDLARASEAALDATGTDATLQTFPGVRHTIDRDVHRAMIAAVARLDGPG